MSCESKAVNLMALNAKSVLLIEHQRSMVCCFTAKMQAAVINQFTNNISINELIDFELLEYIINIPTEHAETNGHQFNRRSLA